MKCLTEIARRAKHEPAHKPPRRRKLVRRERSIEGTCVKYAISKGCLGIKLRPPPAGLPDRLFVLPSGMVAFVEFKRKGLPLSPKQEEFATELRTRHQWFKRFDDAAAFKWWLDRWVGPGYKGGS